MDNTIQNLMSVAYQKGMLTIPDPIDLMGIKFYDGNMGSLSWKDLLVWAEKNKLYYSSYEESILFGKDYNSRNTMLDLIPGLQEKCLRQPFEGCSMLATKYDGIFYIPSVSLADYQQELLVSATRARWLENISGSSSIPEKFAGKIIYLQELPQGENFLPVFHIEWEKIRTRHNCRGLTYKLLYVSPSGACFTK